jgi:hypothetical protein
MYLRINSCLRIPIVALQHSRSRCPIDTGKAHKLGDCSLLLSCVSWRHLVLAAISSSGGWARRELELRGDSGVEIAKVHPRGVNSGAERRQVLGKG